MARRLAHNIVDILINNGSIILTIGVSGYVIYRHDLIGEAFSTDQLLTAILWVLGLLAISEISERYRKLNAIHNSVNRSVSFLESRLADRPSAMAFFQPHPQLSSYIQRANQVDMCGVTLKNTLGKEYGTLRGRIQAGATIRVLLIDPESGAVEMSAQRSMNPQDLDYYRIHLDSSMRELAYLYKSEQENKNFQKRGASGKISIRLLPYAPSFGLISIDAGQKDGIIFGEIYPHRLGFEHQPTFDLTPERDQDWYDYFVKQFEQMWESAKPWDPTVYLKNIPFAPKDS